MTVLFYNFGLFLPAFAWSLQWLFGSYRYRLIDSRLAWEKKARRGMERFEVVVIGAGGSGHRL